MITILIADDQTLMRDGLLTILGLQDDMEVVGTARDGVEALELAEELKPAVILMDIRMPRMNGLECTRRIKELLPETVLLILTTFAENEYIIDALASGAAGFLLKDMPSARLAAAIRDAAAGQFVLPSDIAAKLAARLRSGDTYTQAIVSASRAKAGGVAFTDKEEEVALALVTGQSNREIAAALYLSEGTVKNYVSGLYNKLGTSDRTVAVMMLRELFGSETR